MGEVPSGATHLPDTFVWILPRRFEGLQQRRQPSTPAYLSPRRRIGESLERLVQLYDAWGKPSQAAEWRQKLSEFNPATPGDGNITEARKP